MTLVAGTEYLRIIDRTVEIEMIEEGVYGHVAGQPNYEVCRTAPTFNWYAGQWCRHGYL